MSETHLDGLLEELKRGATVAEVGGVFGTAEPSVVRQVLGAADIFGQWDGDELSGPRDQRLDQVKPSLSALVPESNSGPRSFAQTPLFLDGEAHARLTRIVQ